MTIQLSGLARQDLEEIRDYTTKTWGRDQWLKYYRGLVRTFEHLSEHPDMGRDRRLFSDGMRSVNYERHVIFYAPIRHAGSKPVILRIVHQRRNLPALLYYEDLDSDS